MYIYIYVYIHAGTKGIEREREVLGHRLAAFMLVGPTLRCHNVTIKDVWYRERFRHGLAIPGSKVVIPYGYPLSA